MLGVAIPPLYAKLSFGSVEEVLIYIWGLFEEKDTQNMVFRVRLKS